MCLDGKVRAWVDLVSGVLQGRFFGLLLFMLYTFCIFHVVGNPIVGYADDTMIYVVIPRPHSCQVLKSLNQDLAAINSWCLKWRMRLNSKITKYMVVSLP